MRGNARAQRGPRCGIPWHRTVGAGVAGAVLVAIAGLGGCAVPRSDVPTELSPPPAAHPVAGSASTDPAICPAIAAPDPRTPDPRARALAAAAVAEWRRWGALDVGRLPTGEACACLGPGHCVPVDDGCGREQQSPWCPLVNEYWQRTFVVSGRWFHHDCSRVDVCESRWPIGVPRIHTPAWSAAFISTVMDRAGLADDEFLKTPYHADYVRAAIDGRTSAYRAVPVPAPVAVGDLICSARTILRPVGVGPYRFGPLLEGGLPPLGSGAPIDGSAQSRMAAIVDSRMARRPTPMHCDLVVAIDPGRARTREHPGARSAADPGARGGTGSQAQAIGGNVMQSVARVRYPLDAAGRVVAVRSGPGEPLLVMQRRRPLAR